MDGRLIIGNSRVTSTKRDLSLNPSTLKPIGEFHLADSTLCGEAIRAAAEAFPVWRDTPSTEKRRIFLSVRQKLLQKADNIARLITQEKGSPLVESLGMEVLSSLETLSYHAGKAFKHLRPRKAPATMIFFAHKRNIFHFQPLGPTLIITPWNYPFVLPMYGILSALAAGNTVVFKPSEHTPFTALALGEIFLESGLPPGVLNVINCPIPEAEGMVTHPETRTVMFTGSIATGKRIMELASRNLTNLVLEMGGKDPMIICADADLDRASQGAVWAGFANAGQICSSAERVYVHESIAEEFISRVLTLTESLKVGNPMDEVDMGPLISNRQLEIVLAHIEDAVDKGAKLLCGGERMDGLAGPFLKPAVLTEVDHSMRIMKEETFGPVLPVMRFSEEEEAVRLANDSDFGLTASLWTRDRKKAKILASRLEAGTVTVNDHIFSSVEPSAIWGGVKQSGIGRVHGKYGLLELVNPQYISLDFVKKKKQFWWYPYSTDITDILNKAMVLSYHSEKRQRFKTLFKLIPSLPRIHRESPLRNFIKRCYRIIQK